MAGPICAQLFSFFDQTSKITIPCFFKLGKIEIKTGGNTRHNINILARGGGGKICKIVPPLGVIGGAPCIAMRRVIFRRI